MIKFNVPKNTLKEISSMKLGLFLEETKARLERVLEDRDCEVRFYTGRNDRIFIIHYIKSDGVWFLYLPVDFSDGKRGDLTPTKKGGNVL